MLALFISLHRKPFIPTCLTLLQRLDIQGNTPSVIQGLPRFPRDIGAIIPRVGVAPDALETEVLDEDAPVVFGVGVGVGACLAFVAHRREQLHQPVPLELDARWPVAERRGRVRPICEPEVGEARGRQAQVCPGPRLPLVREELAVEAADRHVFDAACDGVEACRERDHVQRVEGPVGLHYPARLESRDRVRSHIDYVHVGFVEVVVEVLFER